MWFPVCDVFKEESEENSMSNNLIPVIAKELGVEIGEEFKLDGLKYRFTDTQLEVLSYPTKTWVMSTIKFNYLNTTKVIKLPYEPKVNDVYWTYAMDDFEPVSVVWLNYATDYTRKLTGTVFRTKEETIEARPAKYKELTGKDWDEVK